MTVRIVGPYAPHAQIIACYDISDCLQALQSDGFSSQSVSQRLKSAAAIADRSALLLCQPQSALLQVNITVCVQVSTHTATNLTSFCAAAAAVQS